jgi:signal transduction protein with GAF and PtsI domain
MYSNKELANALRILNNECRSQMACNQCPLYLTKYKRCAIEMLDMIGLNNEIIDEFGERDG